MLKEYIGSDISIRGYGLTVFTVRILRMCIPIDRQKVCVCLYFTSQQTFFFFNSFNVAYT